MASAPSAYYPQHAPAYGEHPRAVIARYFTDLRNALQRPHDVVALQLGCLPQTIYALETGHVESLPPWPELARIVTTYSSWAGLDGNPALALIGAVMTPLGATAFDPRQLPPVETPPPPSQRAAVAQSGDHRTAARIRQTRAGMIAHARTLPANAIHHVRSRPDRAFYAVSLPLGLLLVLMNTSVVAQVMRPFEQIGASVQNVLSVSLARVHDGHRWIEVDDPRSRRGDKLPVAGR